MTRATASHINPAPLREFAPDQNSLAALQHTLSSVLADTYRLLLNTQNLHWNGQGRAFFGLHKLTEEQYRELFEAIDEIAERIRALGYPAPATFDQMSDLSTLEDIDSAAEVPLQLKQLADLHSRIANRIKAAIVDSGELTDIGTSDLLTQRVRVHEKSAWLLRSVATS